MRRTLPVLGILALTLAACAEQVGNAPSPDDARPSRSAPALGTAPPSDEPVTGEVPAAILATVVADAADRAGIEPDEVEVVMSEAVTWNDGSLGCPEPDMVYTMALVDGYQVILRAGDEELDYRLGTNGGFKLCEDGGRPSG